MGNHSQCTTHNHKAERMQAALDFIRRHIAARGYPPTFREIGNAIGVSSTSLIGSYITGLEQKGCITRDREVARGIRVISASASSAE